MTSPLTTAQQVRTRIADRWRQAEEIRYGDGSASGFKLAQGAPFSTISMTSAYILPSAFTGWSATGATFDSDLGTVKFSAVISALTAWRAEYQWAVFSDNEIGHFTAVGGTVAGASLEAVRALMFDSLKRSKWAAPDGTQYDDTMAQDTLLKMEERLLAEIVKEEGPAGGIESWAEQQQYWSSEYNSP